MLHDLIIAWPAASENVSVNYRRRILVFRSLTERESAAAAIGTGGPELSARRHHVLLVARQAATIHARFPHRRLFQYKEMTVRCSSILTVATS